MTRIVSTKVRRCPVCAAETAHDLALQKNSFLILRCRECGLGATELPAGFDPDALYNESYFQGGVSDGYGDYLASEPVIRREFRRVLNHIGRVRAPGGRLLEVGCAYGFFLAEASSNYECVGVDVSEAAVEFCRARGLKAYHPNDPAWKGPAPYDVLVMLDCIEHLSNPEVVLDSLRSVAQPNSLLVLTTGDWESLYARASRSHWRLMTPPQHLYFYSAETLRRLLGRFGFRVVEISRPWKVVPVGLMAYQVASRVGLPIPRFAALNAIGFPVNLFDALRVIAVRDR
jgi:SAM-dependent methyltransferase